MNPAGGSDDVSGESSTGLSIGSDVVLGSTQESALLTIDGTGEKSDYAFAVDGDVEQTTALEHANGEATVNPEDAARDGNAWGYVRGGADSYEIHGELTAFELAGDADVYLNGELVDPESLSGESDLPHVIMVDGSDADGDSQYEFAVDGDVAKTAAFGSIDKNDDVSGDGTVSGTVGEGVDAYRFSGMVTSLSLDGNAAVSFGEE